MSATVVNGNNKKLDQHQQSNNNNTFNDDTMKFFHKQLPANTLDPSQDEQLNRVCVLFRKSAYIGLSIYIILICIVWKVATPQSWEQPTGMERSAHLTTALLLFVTNGSRLLPLALRNDDLKFIKNGILIVSLTVQGIAICSNLIMALFPTPVYIDPITGLRVPLLRWVEWTPLAFLMTFLTANLQVPIDGKHYIDFITPTLLALSTLCGGIFPFCKSLQVWMSVFIFSCILFTAIYVLFYSRAIRYYKLCSKVQDDNNKQQQRTAVEQEHYELIRIAYLLSVACCSTWTLLVLTFSVMSLGSIEDNRFITNAHLPEVSMCVFEIASKIWYLASLIDAYEKVFDESLRAARRLEELRRFMSAVWESSSDSIIFLSQSTTHINARVSPAFLKMVGLSTEKNLSFLDRGDISLIIDIYPKINTFHVFAMDISKPITRDDVARFRGGYEMKILSHDELLNNNISIEEKNLTILVNMAIELFQSNKNSDEHIFREFYRFDTNTGLQEIVQCEEKYTKIKTNQSVVVVRDVTDRMQRFEVEKRLVEELTTRKKDTEANHFTRHEVKNGILATLGLLEHLREAIETGQQQSSNNASTCITCDSSGDESDPALPQLLLRRRASVGSCASDLSVEASNDVGSTLDELDSTMRDLLDSILDSAMAKEIVYGEYKPRKEQMLVPDVLGSLRRRDADARFPIIMEPAEFPVLLLDRQLLRYLYRNAISNASKYGLSDGPIVTTIKYDEKTETFFMQVVNLPGEQHESLLQLSVKESQAIFEQGVQLHSSQLTQASTIQTVRNQSSGNGAWIMQKCAEALGGKCTIEFQPDSTMFEFKCPAKALNYSSAQHNEEETTFNLPENTWGIALEDSKVQRRLLDRFFKLSGISDERKIILGAESKEIYQFVDTVSDLITNSDPDEKFIIIADENLDIFDGPAISTTVSGSLLVKELRESLDDEGESRLLTLVRSANDSPEDIRAYSVRAHGYLPKEPFKKGNMAEVLKPFWQVRFPRDKSCSNDAIDIGGAGEEFAGPSSEDIDRHIVVIDALCFTGDRQALRKRWRTIKEKLLILKGDLMSMKSKESLADIIMLLNQLRNCRKLPDDFIDCWQLLRSKVENIIEK